MGFFERIRSWFVTNSPEEHVSNEQVEADMNLENDLNNGYISQEEYDNFMESVDNDREELPAVEDWFDL